MEELNKLIDIVKFHHIGKKTTVCLATLKTGFEIVGTSACIDPNDYIPEIGEKYSYSDVLCKLEEFEAYSNS